MEKKDPEEQISLEIRQHDFIKKDFKQGSFWTGISLKVILFENIWNHAACVAIFYNSIRNTMKAVL